MGQRQQIADMSPRLRRRWPLQYLDSRLLEVIDYIYNLHRHQMDENLHGYELILNIPSFKQRLYSGNAIHLQ